MTVIFSTADFWVERIVFPGLNIEANRYYNETVLLERPGILVGLSGTILHPLQRKFSAPVFIGATSGSNTIFDRPSSRIGVSYMNESAQSVYTYASAVAYLRRKSK